MTLFSGGYDSIFRRLQLLTDHRVSHQDVPEVRTDREGAARTRHRHPTVRRQGTHHITSDS